MRRVWVAFEPLVIRDTLLRVLRELDGVAVVDGPEGGFDVGIFRLAETGMLQDFFHNAPYPEAKMVVLSPRGEKAFVREAGEKKWREVQPFGIAELISAVLF